MYGTYHPACNLLTTSSDPRVGKASAVQCRCCGRKENDWASGSGRAAALGTPKTLNPKLTG